MKLNLKKPEISFNQETHTYTRNSDGQLLAGISSIASLAKDKEFSNILNQWASNSAVNHIYENWDTTKQYTQKEKDELLKEAKTAFKNISQEAKDIGTQVHALIQQYILEKIDGKKSKLEIKDANIKRAMDQFLKWEQENNVEFLASELLVYHNKLEMAGTLDCLAIVNGKKTLIDWKIVNHMGINYIAQLSGYWLCLEDMNWQPEARILVRIPKTATRKIWNDNLKKYEMVENNLEVIEPKTDIEFDKDIFCMLRQVYKWINYAQDKLK